MTYMIIYITSQIICDNLDKSHNNFRSDPYDYLPRQKESILIYGWVEEPINLSGL